jgi:predicted DNA-binding transcriptional regulator AlpA
MRPGPRERREYEAVMRHIYRLPVREQLMVFQALRDYLGGEVGEENIFDKEIHGRQGALEAMRRVADHWHLPEGEAPTTTQHKQAPAEVTAGWSVTRVGQAWGRYRFAQQAFRGEAVPQTVAQRSLRRSTSGRKNEREGHVSGVRRWLDTNPASRTKVDYDDYARQHNSDVLSGGSGLVIVGSPALIAGLGLRWADVLRFCEDGADCDAIRAEALREHLARDYGPLKVISSEGVGHMLGQSPSAVVYMLKRGELPVPVLILARARGWLIKDIEAFIAGRPIPARLENELRSQVMSTTEVAVFLGVTHSGLTSMLHKKSKTAPAPDGRLAQYHYWMREKTERWVAEHGKPHPRRPRGKRQRVP